MSDMALHVNDYRQVIYWRMTSAMFGMGETAPNFETMAAEVAAAAHLPAAVLHPRIGIDTLLQQYPELEQEFKALNLAEMAKETAPATPEQELRRALLFSKLMLNAFGPNTQSPVVSAQE